MGAISQSEILLRAGYSVCDDGSAGPWRKRRCDGHLRVAGAQRHPSGRGRAGRLRAPHTPFLPWVNRWARASRCSPPVSIHALRRWSPKRRSQACAKLPMDYAGLQEYPLLGKTLFAPGAWMMLYRGGKLAGFPASGVSPEQAVAARNFPVLLICDEADTTLPCRHAKRIYAAAQGPKSLWVVPGAFHTAATRICAGRVPAASPRLFPPSRS